MKTNPIPRTAKRLCLALALTASLPAAYAHADCEDDLARQAFAHHINEPSADSRVAMMAWFCQGKSDGFLSQQPDLPGSLDDIAGWDALLYDVHPDIAISSEPSDNAAVAAFRANNCESLRPNSLIHALGRVATGTEFEAWQACDAQAVDDENRTSWNFDLDLSCSGQQKLDGTLVFSVAGFHVDQAFANTDLGALNFQLENLEPLNGADYSSRTIPSGGTGVFEFTVLDPTRQASVALAGSALTEFEEEVAYFCKVDVSEEFDVPSTSIPYVLRREADCAFEAPVATTDRCPGGYFARECIDWHWQDTDTCLSGEFDLRITETVGSGAGGRVVLPDNTNCGGSCTVPVAMDSEARLRAVPNSRTRVEWTGCTSIDGNDCIVRMDGAKSVSAEFIGQATLTVTSSRASGAGGTLSCGTSSCQITADIGSSVALIARPNSNSLATWTGCTGGSGTGCNVRMDRDRTVSVRFSVRQVNLTVGVTRGNGGKAKGTVRGPNNRNCDSGCSISANINSEVRLQANPVNDRFRAAWSGCTRTSGNQCFVQMSRARSVSVTFSYKGINITNWGSATNVYVINPWGVRMRLWAEGPPYEGDFRYADSVMNTADEYCRLLGKPGVKQFPVFRIGWVNGRIRITGIRYWAPDIVKWGRGEDESGYYHFANNGTWRYKSSGSSNRDYRLIKSVNCK